MSPGAAAIILAGGSGSRVQREINKVYLPISNREMVVYALETMDVSSLIDRIVLVVRAEDKQIATDLIERTTSSKSVEVVVGGATRQESEAAGLEHLASSIENGVIDLVAIHDGARPFLTLNLLETIIDAARSTGGAVPGFEVEAPLFRRSEAEITTIEQSLLRRVQTPQAFHAAPLLDAYRSATAAGFRGVDTAETIERFSDLTVTVVPGDRRNIKVTFVEDFFTAEGYALQWESGRWAN